MEYREGIKKKAEQTKGKKRGKKEEERPSMKRKDENKKVKTNTPVPRVVVFH